MIKEMEKATMIRVGTPSREPLPASSTPAGAARAWSSSAPRRMIRAKQGPGASNRWAPEHHCRRRERVSKKILAGFPRPHLHYPTSCSVLSARPKEGEKGGSVMLPPVATWSLIAPFTHLCYFHSAAEANRQRGVGGRGEGGERERGERVCVCVCVWGEGKRRRRRRRWSGMR